MTVSDKLIRILYEMNTRPLLEEVRQEARICILDELGAMYGGAMQLSDRMKKFLDFQPDVPGGATVVGAGGRKASMEHAALWGGICGHVFDIDDGNRFCNLHSGSAVIPAVLAVCETRDLPFDALIRGTIIGFEAAARVALCVQPSHRMHGFHASGTCGTIGAALGVAAALGMTEQEMKDCLSAGVAAASGLLEMQENVSNLKPYNLGHAAMNGVTAVSMVLAGFCGPVDPLGGKRGFLPSLSDEYTTDWLEKEPDGHYLIQDSYHKSYAACRHCHAAIDSTLALRLQEGVDDPENIEHITIRIYAQGAHGHDHKDCPGVVSAKMSVPFAVCLSLVNGAAGIPDYTEETIRDTRVLQLLQRTTVEVDDGMTALVPKKRPAEVILTMRDGRVLNCRTDVARGEPELPLTRDAFIRKFRDLMVYGGKTAAQAEALCSRILVENASVRELMNELN